MYFKECCRPRSRSTSADFSLDKARDELIKETSIDGETFPEEGKTFTPIRDHSKQIIQEQGNVEGFGALGTYEQKYSVNIATCMTSRLVFCHLETYT